MSCAFELLHNHLELPAYNSQTTVKIFCKDKYAITIGALSKKTSISVCELPDWSVRNPTPMIRPLGEPCLEMIETSTGVHAITINGSLYQLLSSSEDFGGSNLYWMKLTDARNFLAVTGLQYGIATIEEINNTLYLNTYVLKKQLVPKTTVAIETVAGDYFIISFPRERLNKELLQAFLAERAEATFDAIFFSTPTGLVYLYPIISEDQNIKPVLIYNERNMLPKNVFLANDGKSIILVYKVGKVVVLFLDETAQKIKYKTFYLISSFVDVIVQGDSSNLTIIWSNLCTLNVATIHNHKLTHQSTNSTVTGVRSLFVVKNEIVAYTVHDEFYKLQFNVDMCSVRSPSVILGDVNKVGTTVEAVKKNLEQINNYLCAIQNEQRESKQFSLTLSENKLFVENIGVGIYRSDIWSLTLEGFGRQEVCGKTYKLENDLKPGGLVEFDVAELLSNGCQTLKACLKGDVGYDYRCLKLNLGSLTVDNAIEDDVHIYITEKINEMLIKINGS